MAELEEQLALAGFLRVHKSYLVNMRYIEKLNYNGVLLVNKEELPISQKRYSEIKALHLQWRSRQ